MLTADLATLALARLTDSAHCMTWSAKSESTDIPASTLWHRANGRSSKEEKAANQEYLTTSEKKAPKNSYPPPDKFLPILARVLRQQRTSSENSAISLPAKQLSPSWVRSFLKRHPEVRARRSKPIDWKRHDYNIRSKVEEWFSVIGSELHDSAIDLANVYNMDETGFMLSWPSSLKVLVGKSYGGSRGARVEREVVTAIECISADGRALHPVVIWPAATHRSTWTTHPTPNWHFACSKSVFSDSAISLYWIKHVFDPQTRAQAGNKPRLLIKDGFGTHESIGVMEFCFENNIILCRLPWHTSHKLQPCDVGVFSVLKTAYREQAESLDRGGASSIGKHHFTYLYSRARNEAFARCNILSGWSKSGLRPFNPERVPGNIQKLPEDTTQLRPQTGDNAPRLFSDEPPVTPVTFESMCVIRNTIEKDAIDLEARGKLRFQKLLNATERVYAERSLFLQRNQELFQQNNEKKSDKAQN